MTASVLPIRKERAYRAVEGCDYLKLHKSGIYYVRKFKSGRGRLFKSTGETLKGRARTKADEMIADFIGGKKSAKRKTVKAVCQELAAVLEQEHLGRKRRSRTHQKDPIYFKHLETLFGDQFIHDIDEDFWENWVQTAGKDLGILLFDHSKYLSKVLTFAHRRKYILRKPKITNPDPERVARRVYTDEEISALVDAADPTTLSQIYAGYESGLRGDEVRCLEKAWLTFGAPAACTLALPKSFVKANARTIELSPQTSRLLWKIISADKTNSPFIYPRPTDPYFCETRKHQNKRWRRVVKASGINPERAWFRYLRTSFYNRTLLGLKLDVQSVSQYGGTSIRTLQKSYLQQDPKNTASIAHAIKISTKGKT